MKFEEAIKSKLEMIGVDSEKVKPFQAKYLEEIETIIQAKETMLKEVSNSIKGCTYSVKSIASEIGMSRTTFYSYERLLQKYVEVSIELSAKYNPYKEIEGLKEDVQSLRERVLLMESRDVNVLLLKHENMKLKKTINDKNKEIDRLRSRIVELSGR